MPEPRAPVLVPARPQVWRLPVPPRIARLAEGERVAEACVLAAAGRPALQAAAMCGLGWAQALLDDAVSRGRAPCLVRLQEIKRCALEAYRYYDSLTWQATGDRDQRVLDVPGDWAVRAGAPLSGRWGALGMVYAYEAQPLVMATVKPAFADAGGDDPTGEGGDLASPDGLLENGDDPEEDGKRPYLLVYTPVSTADMRKRPSPDAELLPGMARARGFVRDPKNPDSWTYVPTGAKPPLVERSHESLLVRASRKDKLTATRHAKPYEATRWHTDRVEEILALVESDPDEQDPEDDDRPGYAFWGGQRMNLAGPKNDSLYEQHEPHTLPDRLPVVYQRNDPLVKRHETVAKPTPLALWWAFNDPLGPDPLRDHGSAVRALLLENANYWDFEAPSLGELKALVRRQAREAGVPAWPTPDEVAKAANRSDRGPWRFSAAAYQRWAITVIAWYAREQLDGIPGGEEAVEDAVRTLWFKGTRGHWLTDGELEAAASGREGVEVPLLQFLFTAEPGPGEALYIKGKEAWARRPSQRTKQKPINGPAVEYGEEAALNQLDQFAAAVRGGMLGEPPRRLLTFASTLRNFLEGALGNATTAGRGTIKWLVQDGEETTLLDLLNGERWRAWQEDKHPERKVFGPDPTYKPLYDYLADPRALYTELAPAVLWVHQVCFAHLTGRGYRLYVSPADLARSYRRGLVRDDQVQAILTAGALGQMTDRAFRSYDPDCLEWCPDWERTPWTPSRLRRLARGAYHIAQRARDGKRVEPEAFRAMAEAMGYPESAVARGLKRLGAGLAVEDVPGFEHLDAQYRAAEATLKTDAHRHGLLGWAWPGHKTFRRVVRENAGYVTPTREYAQDSQDADDDAEEVGQ